MQHRSYVLALALGFAVAAPAASVHAAATAADKCEAGKVNTVAKYAGCVLKAQRAFVLSGDALRYDSAVGKCLASHLSTFTKYEQAAGSGVCPTEGDGQDVADFADACMSVIAAALDGGTLPADLSSCYSDLSTCQTDFATCDGGLTQCQSDLADCLASPGNGVLVTGQTKCYRTDGGQITCAGSGQDADVLAGLAPSYTDNGDGTITDNRTGLVWEKLSNDGSIHDKDNLYSWDDAFTHVEALNTAVFAGHSDWRLPNIRELETIVDFGETYPTVTSTFNSATCPNGCTVLLCSCTRSGAYWSSTSYEPDTTCAWDVGFALGERAGTLKTSTFSVRAVRGGL